MPTLEHRVADLSPTALARRQARARRLLHTVATVEPGLIGLELKRERGVLTRRLHAAAEEGRDSDLVAIQAALTRNRDQMLRIAGFPLPGRAKGNALRPARPAFEHVDVSAVEILPPPNPPTDITGAA